jgi:hypothetical protein
MIEQPKKNNIIKYGIFGFIGIYLVLIIITIVLYQTANWPFDVYKNSPDKSTKLTPIISK